MQNKYRYRRIFHPPVRAQFDLTRVHRRETNWSAYLGNTVPSMPSSMESLIALKILPSAETKKVAHPLRSPIQANWVASSPRRTGDLVPNLLLQLWIGPSSSNRSMPTTC